MNTRDTNINDISFKKLVHDDNYYKHIFKKTEKIVSVVFYIINNIDHDKKSETHIGNIASKAHFVHENALRTLEVKPISSKEVLEQFAQALISLDSTLRIATASHIITQEVLSVVLNEIDVVLRGLSTYIDADSKQNSPFMMDTASPVKTSSAPASRGASQQNSPQAAVTSNTQQVSSPSDRRERIKTILEAKGEATIKDISEIVTDCSEKTIQRELNAMIEDNLVKRQGERRWSKYSIF